MPKGASSVRTSVRRIRILLIAQRQPRRRKLQSYHPSPQLATACQSISNSKVQLVTRKTKRGNFWGKKDTPKPQKEEKKEDTDDSAIMVLDKNQRTDVKKNRNAKTKAQPDSDSESRVLYEIGKGRSGISVRKNIPDMQSDFSFGGADSGIGGVLRDLNKTMGEMEKIMDNAKEQSRKRANHSKNEEQMVAQSRWIRIRYRLRFQRERRRTGKDAKEQKEGG